MKKLTIAIITEKLGTDAASSSTVIADEAIKRGHKVFEFEAKNLRFEEGKLLADATPYVIPASSPVIPANNATRHCEQREAISVSSPPRLLRRQKKKGWLLAMTKEINLEKMDVILFRPNPPVDMAYLTTLFLLRTIEDKVLIINRPSSVINLPEKIFPLYMAKYMPPTLITSNAQQIKKFAAKHGTIILKPLYDFGGHGITKLKKGGKFTLNSNTPIVAQKFLSNVVITGNKRVLFINGSISGAVTRIPKKGSFLANFHQGSELTGAELTKKEQQICKILSKLLKEYDIRIAGVDIVDECLMEVNITSPAGFGSIRTVYGTKPEIELWDGIERSAKA